MTGQWIEACREDMYAEVQKICGLGVDTITTQQLDAAHIWKMTGHSSLYVSSLHNWLTTAAPLMNRSFDDACIAVPWRLRFTSGLQRQIIYLLSPKAAKAPTTYGASATPVMLSTAHQHAWQAVRRLRHIVEKVVRVATNRNLGPQRADLALLKFDSPEFRRFVDPKRMVSCNLYNPQSLEELMSSPERWKQQKGAVSRIATLEQVCHEIGFQPPVALLD